MTKLYNWAIVVLSLVLVNSCAMDELVDMDEETGKYTYVFRGSNTPESKVSIGDKTDGMWPVLWEKGDVLGVFRADGTFVGKASVGDAYAGCNTARFTMSTNVALASGETLHFVYPYSSDITFSDGSFKMSFAAEQSQTASGSSAGIGAYALAHSSAVYQGAETTFVLSHENAYMKVSLTPGEFVGYSLRGLTLWSKGQTLAGNVALDVKNGTLEVSEFVDYVQKNLSESPVMANGKSYSFWLSVLPEDFSGKQMYAIVHMTRDEETVTLPIPINGAGKLLKHSVTSISLPALSKSYVPEWYEPVEKRYIAAYGKGWAYGPQNTVLLTQSNVAKKVGFKARGNFMKVVEPKKIQVVYASAIAADRNAETVYIGGKDAYSNGAYQIFNLDDNYEQSIAVKRYYAQGAKGGHMAALFVMDKDENVIWGTNLWLATKPFVETQYANGKVLDRNIGSDGAFDKVDHWTCNGCYFQWGRPWAFAWTNDITRARKMKVDRTCTLEKSAANPYSYIYHSSEPVDWYYGDGSTADRSDDLDDRWGNPNRSSDKTVTSSGIKSIYDPCPEGYMVVSPTILAEVENVLLTNAVTATEPNYILYNGVSWGFSGAHTGTETGRIKEKVDIVAMWSNSNTGGYGRAISYQPAADVPFTVEMPKTAALPVRCMVEQGNVNGSGVPSGPAHGGGSGGELDDEQIKVPAGFTDEPDDAAADPKGIFDYSVLANAGHPRLLIDSKGFASLKRKVTSDKMFNSTLYKLHTAVMTRTDKIVEADKTFSTTDEQAVIVDNLLHCSYAYRMTGESKYLEKVKKDMQKVCAFADWAPNDLPIGEISFAMAIAYDWLYYDLPNDLRTLARQNMSTKSIRPMYNKSYAKTIGNWNSVCLGGCSCASLAIYEKDKEMAVKQLEKAISENGPAMAGIYEPDGNYGEGLGYWEYGSEYQACFVSALEGIFGNSAGLKEVPGFLKSGEFALFMHGTMNSQFSYSDGGGDKDPLLVTSWWFAAQNDDPDLIFCEKRRLDRGNYNSSTSSTYRLLPVMIAMIRDFDMESRYVNAPVKEVWSGRGELPVTIVRKGWTFGSSDVYLGIKGGHCNTWKTSATSHGHMDAGSFVFEAEGVRWSDDTKKPDYGGWFAAMRAAGTRSGNTTQTGLRWDSFKVNNLCHSTIVSFTNDGSIPDKLHDSDYYVDGYATIDEVLDAGGRQGAVLNMSGPMKGQVKSAKRTVELVNGTDLVVTDEITALDNLDCKLEWRMLTAATPEVSASSVTLTKSSKQRTLKVTASDASVQPSYKTWAAERPGTDYWKTPSEMGWKDMSWDSPVADRVITGWSATVPRGKTVTFVTTLKK